MARPAGRTGTRVPARMSDQNSFDSVTAKVRP